MLIFFGALVAVLVVLAPRLIGSGMRFVQPISRMQKSQSRLEQLQARRPWKRPESETLTLEQVDRFFAVRKRIDAARRVSDPRLDRLPRKKVRSVDELKEVPGILEGVSDMVTSELDAYVAAQMTPNEYHWVARVVYEHWRGELKRAGRYPAAVRAAAAEVEDAAARETDRRVRTRLLALAAELRAREPSPPEGFDPATHRLLLSRLDDIERWSLDDVTSPIPH